ncbi:MAG: hypothetical protein NW220_21895 [Leptolyngbyaceae cyanobacterium bins.349]|nr:hypothetical protein [Leptolyngbyaceae cyanobacterium bins.349]
MKSFVKQGRKSGGEIGDVMFKLGGDRYTGGVFQEAMPCVNCWG